MSVEKLQEKVRKLKNPSVIDFTAIPAQIPPHLLDQEGSEVKAYGRFCRELLAALKGIVPAARFSYSWFGLYGDEGIALLKEILREAKDMGFYVMLDCPEALSLAVAEFTAHTLCQLPCDGMIVSAYIGSDALTPYVDQLKTAGKSLFVVLRTGNKTAQQLQDLMTGSRLMHMAAADTVKRLGESLVGRSGYSQVAGVGAANSADSVRGLRNKYKNMFLLLEGYDYPNANAKNCSFAFDKLGHGAVACAGTGVTAAWISDDTDGTTYTDCAVQAAERMRKNLTRYITIL